MTLAYPGFLAVFAGFAVVAALVATAASPNSAPAQEAPLDGRVVLGPDSVPVPGAGVSLHRIARDTAGVVADDTAGPDGRLSVRLPAADTGDLFLVTARHQGVLYFGPPFHDPAQASDPYTVVVYPSRPLADDSTLPLERRHLVLTPVSGGFRALDVASAANDSAWTWTSSREDGEVWSAAFPPSATGVSVERGGVSSAEVRLAGGRARVLSAVPPGGQRLVLRYQIPSGQQVVLPVRRPVGVFELLVQPPGRAEVTGLEDAGRVQFQGQEYRRYRARQVGPGTVVRFSLSTGGEGGASPVLPWVLAGLGLLLLGVAAWAHRRLRRPAGAGYAEGHNRRKGAG